jgi:hypothetical protein
METFVICITDYRDQDLTKWKYNFWYINFTLSVCKKGTRLYQETFTEKDVTLYVPIRKSIRDAIFSYAKKKIREYFNLQSDTNINYEFHF